MGSDERIEDVFGSERPFSIGVEEELFLVDPVTGRQVNSSAPYWSGSRGSGSSPGRSSTSCTPARSS
jgi:hypothetical protein